MKIAERYDYIARVVSHDGAEDDQHFDDEDRARNFACAVCAAPDVDGVEILLMDWYMHQETSLDYIEA